MSTCTKNIALAGICPCALRGHTLWNTALRRPLTGVELMRIHGFQMEAEVEAMNNTIMSKLAGDTMSVAPVGAILGLALTRISPHLLGPEDGDRQSEHHVGASWIGRSTWRGYDRSKDNLVVLAGLGKGFLRPKECEKPPKARSHQRPRNARKRQRQEATSCKRPGKASCGLYREFTLR